MEANGPGGERTGCARAQIRNQTRKSSSETEIPGYPMDHGIREFPYRGGRSEHNSSTDRVAVTTDQIGE